MKGRWIWLVPIAVGIWCAYDQNWFGLVIQIVLLCFLIWIDKVHRERMSALQKWHDDFIRNLEQFEDERRRNEDSPSASTAETNGKELDGSVGDHPANPW